MKKYLTILLLLLLITGCKYKKYTVTFVDDNTELSSIIVKYGTNLANIGTPKKEGYIFSSWLKDGLYYDTSSPVKEDMTLTASWVEEPTPPNMHKVTFNFGEYKKSQTIDDGALVTEPTQKPKKEKHKFLGWYLDDKLYDFTTPVTSDIELVAKFEKSRILISYDLDGASGIIEVEINKGSIPKKPNTPTKFGYTFSHWSIGDKVYKFDTPLYQDTVIKANFIANVYIKITFDTDGGNIISSRMLVSGSQMSNIPIPVKEGYDFLYWLYDGDILDPNTKFDKDATLKAIYKEKEEEEKEEEIYN